MRRVLFLVIVLATACNHTFELEDRCANPPETGRIQVVIQPEVGFFGAGLGVFRDETLDLDAFAAHVTGAHTDFFGSGGCTFEYGPAIGTTFEWRSSDPAIATVDQAGVVLGKAFGTATITARAAALNVEASREFTVWRRAGE
jgi:hypothetical protein